MFGVVCPARRRGLLLLQLSRRARARSTYRGRIRGVTNGGVTGARADKRETSRVVAHAREDLSNGIALIAARLPAKIVESRRRAPSALRPSLRRLAVHGFAVVHVTLMSEVTRCR
jgi:hypothetical protein